MNFSRKWLRISGCSPWATIVVLSFLFFMSGKVRAQAQTAPESSPDAQQRERIERELKELQSMKQDLQRQLGDFDARMKALENELNATNSQKEAAPQTVQSTNQLTATAAESTNQPSSAQIIEELEYWGALEPQRGFVLVRSPYGELSFGVFAYLRYLNQLGIDPTFTDSFGRTFNVKQLQNFQVNREQINFRGWLFSERFRYIFWVWTQNAFMGEQTQVNVGGNALYEFYDWLIFRGGIFSLPTTRSTSQSFPNWLKIDHRTMSDEYFRGSYTSGIMLEGVIRPGLEYKVALGNNLSTLGVSSAQLDNHLNTMASALWWLPTTHEFGPGLGFGDYEEHKKLATLLGIHYTRSRETRQEQPSVNSFENTQISLSDGTLLFSPNAFNTGGTIDVATYQMWDLEAGAKYKGWSLEGEYYFRRLDDFQAIGFIPVDHVFDHGFQLQASTMLVPKLLQSYITGAKVFGAYGNPWELGFGLTLFPFRRKEMRMNFQALNEHRSPSGNNALPFQVGDNGWIYTVDAGVWF